MGFSPDNKTETVWIGDTPVEASGSISIGVLLITLLCVILSTAFVADISTAHKDFLILKRNIQDGWMNIKEIAFKLEGRHQATVHPEGHKKGRYQSTVHCGGQERKTSIDCAEDNNMTCYKK